MTNRRRVERRNRSRFQVEIQGLAGGLEQRYPARIVELSQQGAFLECELNPPLGSALVVEFPNGLMLAALLIQKGWYLVENRKGFYLGVEFPTENSENRRSIRKLIQTHSLGPAPARFQLP